MLMLLKKEWIFMSRESYKDDRYFEDYIICQNKRIEKFTDTLNKLEKGDLFKVKQCQRYLANFYKDLLSAKYSIGASKHEVRRYYLKYLETVEQCGVSDYAEMIDILSLAILLDITLDNIKFILENTDYDVDSIICALKEILKKHDLVTESDYLLFPQEYEVFYKYIKGNIDTKNFLKFIEEEWYGLCKNFAWYDSHKSKENSYVGYWSWLAGAILKFNSVVPKDVRYVPLELL